LGGTVLGRVGQKKLREIDKGLEASLFNPGWRYADTPLIVEEPASMSRKSKSEG
jgi:hypothetical protein